MNRLAGAALMLMIALASVAASSASQVRGINITPFWATQMTRAETARELDAARSLGAGIIRISVPWAYLQPRDRASFDRAYVARVDWLLRSAHRRGIEVLLQLGATPCWASDDGVSAAANCATAATSTAFMRYPPRHFADFGRIATWVAHRWGPDLAAVEIHNEANIIGSWHVRSGGGDRALAYMRLLRAGYRAIKAQAPHITVVGGTLAFTDAPWLRRLERLGLRHASDAVSVHPYAVHFFGADTGFLSPWAHAVAGEGSLSFRDGIPAFHRAMVAAGDHHPMWLTEFGYASCPDVPYCVSPKRQADWLGASFQQASRLSYVGGVLSYCLRDYDPDPRHWATFGVLNGDFTRKPSFYAVKRTLHRLR